MKNYVFTIIPFFLFMTMFWQSFLFNSLWYSRAQTIPISKAITHICLQWGNGNTILYFKDFSSVQFSSIAQSCPTLCDPMNSSTQASLSITNFQSSLRLTSIESVMPSSHLILCRPLLFLPSIFPSIRVFSKESALLIRWPKYWSFRFNISPSNDIQDWFPLGWTGLISLQSKELSRVFSNTTVQKHQFLDTQLSL